jgi:hypothetical protein
VGACGTSATKTTHGQAAHSQLAIAQRAHRDAAISDGDGLVKTPAPSVLCRACDASLPSELEQLLVDVVADGFVAYCLGPRAAPWALLATYQWDDYVDLVTIRRFDRIITARVPAPRHAHLDVFDPKVVVWAYEGPPQPALQALLNLLPPHHPDAPASIYPAPPALHIPRSEQRPMTIRVPSPRATTRAHRLAIMTADRDDTDGGQRSHAPW